MRFLLKTCHIAAIIDFLYPAPSLYAGDCIGYSGPSGPCYTGHEGGLYTGPGGGAYSGPSSPHEPNSYQGPRNPCLSGLADDQWLHENCPNRR